MSENNKRPSFQFYPSDWLSDPNVMAMTDRERGAYIHILATMWTTKDCSLKANLDYLARLSGSDRDVIASISHCFIEQNGTWRHNRLDYEREKQNNYFEICSKAGKRGNEKRWRKHKKSPPDRSPSPSPSSTVVNTLVSKFEILWSNYPKKRNKGQAEKAFKNITAPVDVLIAAIEKQKLSSDWKKNGGQFIPYLATWLNAKGWEDEVEVEIEKGDDYYVGEMETMGIVSFATKYGKELAMKYSKYSKL